ncbi:MAG: D-glycero-alpha-D-manno-heptose-1,7-bisphosphate 7-phosphatase [Chitinophagaceae bacterium]|jgi:histidinol-phosphate phosphatase family protein
MNHHSIPPNQLPAIDKTWTLFLDRDGVINTDVIDDYIKSWEEFMFTDGCIEALKLLATKFQRIIVVSNQRGVGRGLMTQQTLDLITENMMLKVEEGGGRIDKAYYCTSTDNKDINRKPNSGMALQAQADFPEINLNKSIMVGNMAGDMWFGRNIGAFTVYIPTRTDGIPDASTVDAEYKNLLAFAQALEQMQPTQ